MSKNSVSLVVVLRDAAPDVARVLGELSAILSGCCDDHQMVVVDRGSTDGTVEALEAAVLLVPNVQVFCLVDGSEKDAAYLAGLEQAVIGDCVVLFDPACDDPDALPAMIEAVRCGADLALATPPAFVRGGAVYRALSGAFVSTFRRLTGVDLRVEANRYRALSRRVVTFVLKHDTASLAQQAIPLLGGFKAKMVEQGGKPMIDVPEPVTLAQGFRRAFGMVAATSTVPLRLTTISCALGAFLSLLMSVYTVATYLLRAEVAPGWTTLSLQLSAMFFLMSVAVAMLAEHVLTMSASSHRRPPYHVAREIRSPVFERERRLNLVVADGQAKGAA